MINIHKILTLFTTIFLVLVFSFPRTLADVKIIFLGVLIILFVFNRKLNLGAVKILFFYSLFFILPVFIASIYGNEMIIISSALKVYIVFPVLLTLIFQNFNKIELGEIVYNAGVVALSIITITSLSTLLNGLGYFPINLNAIFYKDEDRIGLNEGYVHIINSPLSYYLFLIPVVFSNAKDFNFKNKKLYLFIFLFIFAIVTGRRILLLPFLFVIIYQFRAFYKYSIVATVFFFLFFSTNKFENFDPKQVIARFEDALNSKGESAVREEQGVYFLKYINQKPITGYGIGAYMGNYLRNDEYKAAYENSYHYLVFCIGAPLSFLLFCFYLYLLYNAWKLGSENFINRGIIIGILSLLFASYTNPYWLSSFDYTIPFAILITLSSKLITWKKYTV